jgi:CubicO group peptidase (beta-lactamase class C family)
VSDQPTRAEPERPATAAELGLMQGSPPRKDVLVTLDRWQDGPHNRWSFQHIAQLIPCARVPRGERPPAPLPADPRDLGTLPVTDAAGGRCTLDDLLTRTYTDGFLVVHRGVVVSERYFNGMERHTRHLLQSVSKSVTGALAGVLVGRGQLDPSEGVTSYVPELLGTAHEGATVRHLLDMTAGTRFSEEYDDPRSDVRRYEAAAGWRPADPGDEKDLFAYMTSLPNQRSHGEVFEYRSILTDLLGWVIERAAGRRFADLLSDLLWGPLGAEWDAEITVDRHGNPMPDGGLCVTLRDLARLGLLYLGKGVIDGRRVVPEAWIEDTRRADDDCRRAFAPSEYAALFPHGHYRNQWWVPEPERGVLLASGIYGQYLYVDQTAGVVVAKLSSLPAPYDLDVVGAHRRAFVRLAARLADA